MRKIKLPVREITQELVIDLINEHSPERNRILKLKRYFNNENEIVNRNYIDKNKPMNKLSHNYAAMITNSFTGYFLGKPVSYKSDNEGLLEQLNDVFMYNDEADVNTSIGEEASICGYAYEIMYMDSLGQLRFKPFNTEDTIVVYDNTLEENIQFGIRYYDVYSLDSEQVKEVEIYTKNSISTYLLEGGKLTFIQ